MTSRGDTDRYVFGDSASVHGLLSPWSEDQTTTTYSAEHMQSLRQPVRATSAPLEAAAPSWRESSWDDSPEIIEIRAAAGGDPFQATLPPASQAWEEDLAEYRQDTGAAIAAAWSEAERELQARREQQQLTAAQAPKQSGAYAKQTLPQPTGQFAHPQQSGQFVAARPQRRQATAFPAPQPTAAQTQPARPMRAPRTLPERPMPQPTAAARSLQTAQRLRPMPAPLALPALELDEAPPKRESIWVGPAGYAVAGVVGLLTAVFFGQALFDPGVNPAPVSTAPSMPAALPVAPPTPVENDPVAAAAASSLPSQPSAASTHVAKTHASNIASADGTVHMTWRERRAARLAAEAEARAERQNAAPAAPAPESNAAPHEASHSAATRDVLADDVADKNKDKADDLLAPSAPVATQSADDSPASTGGAHGTLRINSRPWSQVYVDGKLLGNTPQMSIDVKPGTHNVRLVNAEFSMSKVIEVNVAPGEVVSRVEMLDE